MSSHHLRWGAVTVIAAAGLTVIVTTTAMPRSSDAPEALEVVLTDASTRKDSDCDPQTYQETFFDGTEVELADGAGEVLATAAVTEPVASTERGCTWTVTFGGLPEVEAYTLALRHPDFPSREHVYRYTAAELAEDESLWIAVVR